MQTTMWTIKVTPLGSNREMDCLILHWETVEFDMVRIFFKLPNDVCVRSITMIKNQFLSEVKKTIVSYSEEPPVPVPSGPYR